MLTVDVAVIKVTEPHKGFCSLGLGVECTRDFIRHAGVVVAEVTPRMPWTEGGQSSKVRVEEIDWWVMCDEPLKTTEQLWPDYIEKLVLNRHPPGVVEGMGKNIATEIPDGATLKFGWNPITYVARVCHDLRLDPFLLGLQLITFLAITASYSVFPYLRQRKNLGLHTDVMTEGLFRLQERGVINNTEKSIDVGRSVVSQAHGSKELYDFLDRNPAVEFHSVGYVNDPLRLARIKNLVSIVGALKVDLTGQVATDSIAHKFYGGVWSVDESVRGARLSDGGKSIVALPSKSLQGRSNIVFDLPPGK